uniref:Uncharacterized protein n=1 Tax=Tetranychus urticae TaxID=32264 RepID=T1JPX4_TETUR
MDYNATFNAQSNDSNYSNGQTEHTQRQTISFQCYPFTWLNTGVAVDDDKMMEDYGEDIMR